MHTSNHISQTFVLFHGLLYYYYYYYYFSFKKFFSTSLRHNNFNMNCSCSLLNRFIGFSFLKEFHITLNKYIFLFFFFILLSSSFLVSYFFFFQFEMFFLLFFFKIIQNSQQQQQSGVRETTGDLLLGLFFLDKRWQKEFLGKTFFLQFNWTNVCKLLTYNVKLKDT